MLKVQLQNNQIQFGNQFSVSFQRTLRIPDDDRIYPLPPGLGVFPVYELAGNDERLPGWWNDSDVLIPVYQREALWIAFEGVDWRPNAVKVGIGKINAVSGERWDTKLHDDPQDYLVCPLQPWLDGINAGENYIRQFVSMPLGEGYTVEAQVAGSEQFGGIQLIVYEAKPNKFTDRPPRKQESGVALMHSLRGQSMGTEMGLGAGGKMKQKIYPDPHGIETWDPHNYGAVFAHLVNSEQFRTLTGYEPPPTPISAQTYTEYGLPWFDLYDEALSDVAAPESLTRIESVKELEAKKDIRREDDRSIGIIDSQIKKLL
ncbi:MAG TPA: hypothetical protein DC054_20310 [Blastocatellia bacterium]|nr:hypothetical protein [Blastocatellia bacterium]